MKDLQDLKRPPFSQAALDATKKYATIAKRAGMPLTELALRWAKDAPQVSCIVQVL